ncbi:MAG: hypothetical protein HXO60_07075 [Rothia mucilaginosa]|uniref:hypothetical protein n=1 Tax=Rothia mucilaginosa TaxID=43675 RepID=UPI001CB15EA1|nr:hypothetical protein [Rothia mucilaginosa]MBF1652246.1 hypothetical protein [Rothia mucilaginosa]
MSVKIPLSYAVAAALGLSALATSYGREFQKKYYKKLLKISFTSKDEMARKLANSIIYEDLRLRFDPTIEED